MKLFHRISVKDFWDQSAEKFAGITEATKDNEEVAWPALLRELDRELSGPGRAARILDFGCGAGQLAHLIGRSGRHEVLGLDPTPNMIAEARKQTTPGVNFVVGGIDDLEDMDLFDGIVSSMVLQFVEAARECLRLLAAALRPGGLLAFVVFNPSFISGQLAAETDLFFRDDSGCLRMSLDDKSTPVHGRSSGEYEEMLRDVGFEQIKAFPLPYSEDQGLYSDRFLILSCRKP